jgi:hypothetical protein
MADRAKPESTFSVNFDTSIASSAPAPSRPRRPAGRGDRGAAGDGGGGRGARAVAPAVSDVANVSDLDGFDLAEPDAIVAGSLARRSSESDTESSVPVQAYGRKPPVWSLSAMQHRHTIREGGDTAEKLFQELLQSSQAALEAAEREKFDAISRAEEAERASAASSERERRLLRASGGGGGGGGGGGRYDADASSSVATDPPDLASLSVSDTARSRDAAAVRNAYAKLPCANENERPSASGRGGGRGGGGAASSVVWRGNDAASAYDAPLPPRPSWSVLGMARRAQTPEAAASERAERDAADAKAKAAAAKKKTSTRVAAAVKSGAFYLTLVPIRPRRRGERRSLRTFSPGVRLSPPRVPRFQSRHPSMPFDSASDAFQLHPAVIARTDPRPSEVLSPSLALARAAETADVAANRAETLAGAMRTVAELVEEGRITDPGEALRKIRDVARRAEKTCREVEADAARGGGLGVTSKKSLEGIHE